MAKATPFLFCQPVIPPYPKRIKMGRKDYQDFKININMKTIMLFEEISEKSFYDMSNDDIYLLIYCAVVVNNNITITYPHFKTVMKNEKIARELFAKCQSELDFIEQFKKYDKEKKDDKVEDEKPEKLSNIINLLILQYGVDISYVMNEMKIWELSPMVKALDEKSKSDMVEKRFWTYLNICPHIDSKKVKGPEDLLPFPWEKETKKEKQLKDLENNRFAIQNMIGKSIFGEPIKKEEDNNG